MKKILLVFGTRPEAVKMCPLVQELRARRGIKTVVCVTGQHREMLDQILKTFSVTPDYDLSVMKDAQTLFDVTTGVLEGLKSVLEAEKPDVVLVQGDTTTAFAAALAAYYLRIPVGHVEAGLRTRDIYSPYPEEFNRQAVSVVSRYNFAPTEQAKENLLAEGRDAGTIHVTGNTVIDALKTTVRADYTHPELAWAAGKRLILITAHRRENLGEPMRHMFRAIRRVLDEHDDVRAIYPIHRNPAVRETAAEVFGGDERIHIIEPLDVPDFHNFLARSYLVLTDSGGIQEEAPSLGKPVLVMRDTTERPEGIAAGTLRLVGTREEAIYASFTELLDNAAAYEKMSRTANPYGDGHACRRIADILCRTLHNGQQLRRNGCARGCQLGLTHFERVQLDAVKFFTVCAQRTVAVFSYLGNDSGDGLLHAAGRRAAAQKLLLGNLTVFQNLHHAFLLSAISRMRRVSVSISSQAKA